MLCAVSKELKDSNLSCRREENVFAVQWTVSQFSLLLEIRVAFFNNISSCLGSWKQAAASLVETVFEEHTGSA